MNCIGTSIIQELQKKNEKLQIELKEIKELLNKIIIQIYYFLILFYVLVHSGIRRSPHSLCRFIQFLDSRTEL